MKRVFTLLLAVMLFASVCFFPVSAAEVEYAPDEVITSQGDEGDVSPRFMHHYTKTVYKVYVNYNSIPQSIYYEEFNDQDGWFVGTLYLVGTTKLSNGHWQATFRGTLQGYI